MWMTLIFIFNFVSAVVPEWEKEKEVIEMRRRYVFDLASKGQNNAIIARTLNISEPIGKKLPAEVRIKISQSRIALFNGRRKRAEAVAISIDKTTTA
jgi:hypothetical protein